MVPSSVASPSTALFAQRRLTDQIVKRYVAAIGKYAGRFGAHSLRAGLVTSAALAGVSEK